MLPAAVRTAAGGTAPMHVQLRAAHTSIQGRDAAKAKWEAVKCERGACGTRVYAVRDAVLAACAARNAQHGRTQPLLTLGDAERRRSARCTGCSRRGSASTPCLRMSARSQSQESSCKGGSQVAAPAAQQKHV